MSSAKAIRGLQRSNKLREKSERNQLIVQLRKRRMSPEDIVRVLEERGHGKISVPRVYAIIKREFERIEDETKKMAKQLLYQELETLDMIIKECWMISQATCRTCQGSGMRQPIAGVALEEACVHCRGEGKLYPVADRMKAMGRVQGAISERAKLLGLYAPDKMAITDSDGNDLDQQYRREIEKMSPDQLDQALNDFRAGIEAGLQIAADQ